MKLLKLFVILLSLGISTSTWAQVTLTAATGGGNISLDTHSSAPGAAWTTLTGPVITETATGQIATGAHVLTLPAGWRFNTGAAVTIAIGGGGDIVLSAGSYSPTANTLTFTVNTASTVASVLTFSNMQVQPTGATTPSTVDITHSGTAIAGIVDNTTSFATLTSVAGAQSAYRITAASATPVAGASDLLTIRLVDRFQNTVLTFTGTKNLTFSGLAAAPNGALASVTDNTLANINLGTSTAIDFSAGVSNLGGTLIAKKVEGPVTLAATDGVLSTSTTGGAGVSLTVSVGAATQYLVISSSYIPVISTNVTITAQLADQFNNPVATLGNSVVWTRTGTGTFAASPTLTNASGVATATFTVDATIATSQTVTATTVGVAGTSSAIISYPPAPALTAPVQYAVGITALPELNWNGSAGVTAYEMEISLNADFSSPIVLNPVYTSPAVPYNFLTNYATTANTVLANGKRHYWRVRQTVAGLVSPWGSSEFTTINPAKPTINTVEPGPASALITWATVPYSAGIKYYLLYAPNADMSGAAAPIDCGTKSYYTLPLIFGTTYYVQVLTKNTADTKVISYSTVYGPFTAATLPMPTPTFPTDPGVDGPAYVNPPSLFWTIEGYEPALTYEIEVVPSTGSFIYNNTTAVGAVVSNGPNVGRTSTTTYVTLDSALIAGTTYKWQVRTVSGTGHSVWSTASSTFTIYSTVPATAPVPVVSWPVGSGNGPTSYVNPPILNWYTGTYATGLYFWVEWDNDGNFGNGVMGNSGWITNMYFALPTALVPGNYIWRVKSRVGLAGGESGWNVINGNFVIPTVATTVPVPMPILPAGTANSLTPTFKWYAQNSATLEYKITISPYSSTNPTTGQLNHPTAVTSSSWISGTTSSFAGLSLPSFTLVAGATYYWQVQAQLVSDHATTSNWSYVSSFSTAAGSMAVVPVVSSPSHGQPINNTSAVLSWIVPSKTDAHLKYDVEYSKTIDFKNSLTVKDVNEPVTSVKGLDANSNYYWRVVSKNNLNGSVSSYSEPGLFNTGKVTAIEKETLPTEYSLDQNYPNPFNPTTVINYSLPISSFVTLKVYDMLGREVKALVNQDVLAGRNSVQWNGDDNSGSKVATGVYVYRITANNFVSSKKMLLIK